MPTDSYVNGLKLGNDGFYRYRFVLVNKNTGKKQVYKGNTGEKVLFKAEKILDETRGLAIQAIRLGLAQDKKITLEQAIIKCYDSKKATCKSDHPEKTKSSLLKHFKALLSYQMKAITCEEVQECLNIYMEKTNADNQIKNYGGYNNLVTTLTTVFKWAVDNEYISKYKLPKRHKQQETPKEIISAKDYIRIIEWIDANEKHRVGFAIRLGLYLGLRSCEVVRATWKCLDIENWKWTNFDTKGLESESIKIHKSIQPFILSYIEKHNINLEAMKNLLMFQQSNGKPVSRKFYDEGIKRAMKAIFGYITKGSGTHTLRRSFITVLHDKKTPIKLLQKLARHKDLSTTLRYVKVDSEAMEEAIDSMFEQNA